MRFHLCILAFFLCLAWLPSALVRASEEAAPITLERLDTIVAQAKDLDSFLANEKLVNEYFLGLEEYFGPDKFKRVQFDAIIKQLKDIKGKVPGLKKRLWDLPPGTGKEFSIAGTVKTRGRLLNQSNWKAYQAEQLQKLAALSPAFSAATAEELPAKLAGLQAGLEEKAKTFRESPEFQSANRQQKKNLEAKFFQELRGDPLAKEAAAHYAAEILKSEKVQDLLGSGDPDLILDTLYSLKEKTRDFLPAGAQVNGATLSEIRNLLPDVDFLLKDEKTFPIQYRATRSGQRVPVGAGSGKYTFKPVPRRLHGIWKGVVLGECVGGNCNSLNALTPERWATVALKDSELHYLEKENSYLGFIEAIPGKVGKDTYAAVTFGAPQLRNPLLLKSADGGIDRTTLYEQWVLEATNNKPKDWKGYVLSASNEINNAGVNNTVRESLSHYFGHDVTNNGEQKFTHLDPMAAKIVANSPKESYAATYGGNMITGATTPTAVREKTLTLLMPVDSRVLKDPTKAREWLVPGDERALGTFRYLLGKPGNEIALNQFAAEVLREPDSAYSAKLMEIWANAPASSTQVPALVAQENIWLAPGDDRGLAIFERLLKRPGREDSLNAFAEKVTQNPESPYARKVMEIWAKATNSPARIPALEAQELASLKKFHSAEEYQALARRFLSRFNNIQANAEGFTKILPAVLEAGPGAWEPFMKVHSNSGLHGVAWQPEWEAPMKAMLEKMNPGQRADFVVSLYSMPDSLAADLTRIFTPYYNDKVALEMAERNATLSPVIKRLALGLKNKSARAAALRQILPSSLHIEKNKDHLIYGDTIQDLLNGKSLSEIAVKSKLSGSELRETFSVYQSLGPPRSQVESNLQQLHELIGNPISSRADTRTQAKALEFFGRGNYNNIPLDDKMLTAVESLAAPNSKANAATVESAAESLAKVLPSSYPGDAVWKRLEALARRTKNPRLWYELSTKLHYSWQKPELGLPLAAEFLSHKEHSMSSSAQSLLAVATSDTQKPLVEKALRDFMRKDPTPYWRARYGSTYSDYTPKGTIGSIADRWGIDYDKELAPLLPGKILGTAKAVAARCSVYFSDLSPRGPTIAHGRRLSRLEDPSSAFHMSPGLRPFARAAAGAMALSAAMSLDMITSTFREEGPYGLTATPYSFEAIGYAMELASGIKRTGEEWLEEWKKSDLNSEQRAQLEELERNLNANRKYKMRENDYKQVKKRSGLYRACHTQGGKLSFFGSECICEDTRQRIDPFKNSCHGAQ